MIEALKPDSIRIVPSTLCWPIASAGTFQRHCWKPCRVLPIHRILDMEPAYTYSTVCQRYTGKFKDDRVSNWTIFVLVRRYVTSIKTIMSGDLLAQSSHRCQWHPENDGYIYMSINQRWECISYHIHGISLYNTVTTTDLPSSVSIDACVTGATVLV